MITYEKHPELSYTQKRQHVKDLRNTIEATLAGNALDTWTAFCLLQDIQFEVLDSYGDFANLKEILEGRPDKRKEHQKIYDAVKLGLSGSSSRDMVDFSEAYLVLQNIVLDLVRDAIGSGGENINIDQ